MKNTVKGFIFPLIVVVIALIAAVGTYVVVRNVAQVKVADQVPITDSSQPSESSTSYVQPIDSHSSVSLSTSSAGVSANVTAHMNITGTDQVTTSCSEAGCFDQKFATCSVASYDTQLSNTLEARYQILKPVANGCRMTFTYPKNPNPVWVNKSMTCTFNNKEDLQTSIGDVMTSMQAGTSDCTGPLADVIRSMFNQ